MHWGEETYYPWLLNEILLPLAGEEPRTTSAMEVEQEHEAGSNAAGGKGKQRVG